MPSVSIRPPCVLPVEYSDAQEPDAEERLEVPLDQRLEALLQRDRRPPSSVTLAARRSGTA